MEVDHHQQVPPVPQPDMSQVAPPSLPVPNVPFGMAQLPPMGYPDMGMAPPDHNASGASPANFGLMGAPMSGVNPLMFGMPGMGGMGQPAAMMQQMMMMRNMFMAQMMGQNPDPSAMSPASAPIDVNAFLTGSSDQQPELEQIMMDPDGYPMRALEKKKRRSTARQDAQFRKSIRVREVDDIFVELPQHQIERFMAQDGYIPPPPLLEKGRPMSQASIERRSRVLDLLTLRDHTLPPLPNAPLVVHYGPASSVPPPAFVYKEGASQFGGA